MHITKLFRNFFIACVAMFGISFIYRTFKKKSGPLVRVLVFHDVQNAKWFKESVTFLVQKYHVISPEDFMHNRFDRGRINVLFTFDDGYTSWNDVCVPILREQNIQALFFINSGLVDVYGDRERQEKYVKNKLKLSSLHTTISWNGVKELLNTGHTIGGHTINHTRLSELRKKMQQDEIKCDKERIEKMIEKQIFLFAYPFGQQSDYTEDSEVFVKGVGYTYAFTTEGVFANQNESCRVSRLCIEDFQSRTSITNWIEGGYDVYRKLKSLCVR